MARRTAAVAISASVVVILCITSPLMVQGWRNYRSAERMFDGYANAETRGQLQDAWSFCSADFKAVTSFAEFTRQHKALEAKYRRLKSIARKSMVVEGRGSPTSWVAVIDADLTFERQQAHFTYELHDRNGSWELQGSQER